MRLRVSVILVNLGAWQIYAYDKIIQCHWFRTMTSYHRKRIQMIWQTASRHRPYVTLQVSSRSVDVMARLFVGELPIRWRRMSRGVLYYQQYDCFSKAYSGWQHTKHPKTKHYCSSVRKPPNISGLSLQRTSYSGSVLMSSCHDAGIVLTWFGSLVLRGPALGWHSKRWYWVWSYDRTCLKRKLHIAYD